MTLAKHYSPIEVEPRLNEFWKTKGIYKFSPDSDQPVYSIDTPPPTVSGNLHLGHTYSYSHADFCARFWRMNGYNVFYPMGYDDNGLPTERLVEKRLGISARQVRRSAFIAKCLEISERAELDYQQLWQRLGLSIDWHYTYRTIDEQSRALSQRSFLELFKKDLIYQSEAPAIWCSECETSLAQADLNDIERQSELVTLAFDLESVDQTSQTNQIPIATTRPELLSACVAIFIHPEDDRYRGLAGKQAVVPLFDQVVPILEDTGVDLGKGSGAVMCCTFGDATDIAWWRKHQLPVIQVIDKQGRMTSAAGEFLSLSVIETRQQIKQDLENKGFILFTQPIQQSIRVHERCDTPVEYIMERQWFIKLLDYKQQLLDAGEQVSWHPGHMAGRYIAWVENLNWDWCISRQRYYGVPIPLWYCKNCSKVILAEEEQLPIDPTEQLPLHSCSCGNSSFIPERDILDTWATSSLTPQIAGQLLTNPILYEKVYPFSLRPQAHEIIRTWAFYTLVKSLYQGNNLPWKNVLISGWGIAGEGMGKISKSRGGGALPPMEMIKRYSADAVRYWASSTGLGKDAIISEDKIQVGTRLVTKLWNVARFSENFINPCPSEVTALNAADFSAGDRWILTRLQVVIKEATAFFIGYDYTAAKNKVEEFFWRDLADNYLEMSKLRLYDPAHPQHEGARATLYQLVLNILKFFAPFLPYVTEEIFQGLFAKHQKEAISIHTSQWPQSQSGLEDMAALSCGEIMLEIASTVRRYKSENKLPLGSDIELIQISLAQQNDQQIWQAALPDISGITRARKVVFVDQIDVGIEQLHFAENIKIGIKV